MTPDSCICCMRTRTSSPLMPNGLPTALHGSGTSGKPAWVARTMARSIASMGGAGSDGQVETDMKLLLLGHVEHGQSRSGFDCGVYFSNALGGFRGQYKPHIEAVLTAVIMRHLGKGIHHLGNAFEVILWHRQCCQRQPAAEAFGMVHG